MKYLKLHPINENMNWLLSKKDDIIECSYDITDMPYEFYFCGNVPDETDISYYLSYDGKSYVVQYVGEISKDLITDDGLEIQQDSSVSGSFKDDLKVSKW